MDENTSDADMMQISIGQGAAGITPLQLNMITCAIANNGRLMKPYLVDSVKNSAGSITREFKPSAYGDLMTETEAAAMQALMEAVVTEGTASRLKDLSYTAAGKTGSAEFNSKGNSHAWFVGFAPADKPKIAVSIVVEAAGTGNRYAVSRRRLCRSDCKADF